LRRIQLAAIACHKERFAGILARDAGFSEWCNGRAVLDDFDAGAANVNGISPDGSFG